MRTLVLLCALSVLIGCVERKPFPQNRFREIARRCGFTAVKYVPRKSFWWADEPLIDFSGERDPKKATVCFDGTDLQLSKEQITKEQHEVAYVWEVRA